MTFLTQLTRESRPTLALAFPLITGQLSHMLTALADTVMIGALGVIPLAAATFANTLLHVPLMFAIGLAIAVSIRVSQARGARQPEIARSTLRHGLYLTAAMAVVTVLIAFATVPLLPFLGQDPEVYQAAPGYFLIVATSFIPVMGAMVIKNHADAMNHPWPPLFILLGGVALNVFLNWLLIFGNWGFPAWGLEGAAVATLLARILTLAGLVAWCRSDRRLSEWVPRRWLAAPEWTEVRKLWSLGWPSSLQILAEISAFVLATLLIGTLGADALASHQVAITCAATIYMVPVGMSQALTVRIGEAFGARRFDRLRPILAGGWVMSALFICFSASAFFFGNGIIAGWFLRDEGALLLAASLLQIAAIFQFSDAMQVISVGALRGLGNVRYPAWMCFFVCWFVSIPVGWVMAFPLNFGVQGIWWGFTAGLTVLALTFGWRAWQRTRYIPAIASVPVP